MQSRQAEAKYMGTDFWWEFVNKGIMDCVHPGSRRLVFRLQFGNFFFHLFDLISDSVPLFACGARPTFQDSTSDWLVLAFDPFTAAG
jgi:hypothetical protein